MDTDKLHLQEELIDINKIIPYQNNYKSHPDKQVTLLASHIAESGWDQPIVVDKEMVIIKGHGRLMAAKKLGLKEVPVKVRADLTPTQVKAARIADNKISELAKDEKDLLSLDLQFLEGEGMLLEELGFSEKELIKLGIKDHIEDGGANYEEPPQEWLVIAQCKDEVEQAAVFEELQARGIECKLM